MPAPGAVNRTRMKHPAPPASVCVPGTQSPVVGASSAKPEVAAVVSAMVIAVVGCWPVLVSVNDSVTLAPTRTSPKLVAEPAVGASASPATVCPLAVAVNVTEPPGDAVSVSVPVRVPAADGRIATAIVQLPPPGSAPAQPLLVTRTSPELLFVSVARPAVTSPPFTTVQLKLPVVLPTTTVP